MFPAHNFTTWCSPFVIKFLISRSWLGLRSICPAFCLRQSKGACVSLSLEVGDTFLVLSYFEAKGKSVFQVVRFHTVTLFRFDFPLNFLKSLLATHYVACSFLSTWLARKVKRVLAFPQIARFDPDSSIKLFSSEIEKKFFPKYGVVLPRQSMTIFDQPY